MVVGITSKSSPETTLFPPKTTHLAPQRVVFVGKKDP
jgi:hypothetical protein